MPNGEDIVQDDTLLEPDKTDITNEDDALEDLPNEDDELEGLDEKDKKPEEDKVDKSEVVQKIKYREKYKETRSELAKVRAEIEELKARKGTPEEKPSDDKELAAKRYIANIAKEAIKEHLAEKETLEKREIEEFEDAVDEIVDDNPEIQRAELLKVVEDFDVAPDVALKILQRQKEVSGKGKPKMPTPKRAPVAPSEKAPVEDSKKSMYQIAQDVIRGVKERA